MGDPIEAEMPVVSPLRGRNPMLVAKAAATPVDETAEVPEWVPPHAVCGRCRKPFAETRPSAKWRKAHGLPDTAPEGDDDVREGKCETHGWQQYVR